MKYPCITQETTFDQAMELAAQYLPEGWTLCIDLERGSGCVQIHNTDVHPNPIDFDHSELTMAQRLDEAICYAIDHP